MRVFPFLCMVVLVLWVVDIIDAAAQQSISADCSLMGLVDQAFDKFKSDEYKDIKDTKAIISDVQLDYFIKSCPEEKSRTRAQYIQLSRSDRFIIYDQKKS